MKTTQVIFAASTFAAGVIAGSATIKNNCAYPIYAWSIGDTNGPRNTIAPGDSWNEGFYSKKDGGGISLKVSKSSVLDATASLSQLEYTANDKLWYDLSNIDLGGTGKAPFAGHTLDLVPSYESCPRVTCAADDIVCSAAYNNPDDVRTKACAGDTDLYLDVCQPASSANMSYKSLIAARDAKPEVAAPHTHIALSHVHARIRRSRIFGRR